MLNVRDFGAVGDGKHDDAAAIQQALDACTPYDTVFFPSGVYGVGRTLTIRSDHTHVLGPAVLRARDGAVFDFMLFGSKRTGCTVRLLTFDANRAGRPVGTTGERCSGAAFGESVECVFDGCTARNTRGNGKVSAAGLVMGGGSTRCRIIDCTLVDCGAEGFDSDGVFTSGDQNVIANCIATRCNDTAFVLESSNFGVITGCTAMDCSAAAAITNASDADKRGNVIDGLTASSRFNGQTGQLQIGVPSRTKGNLLESIVANVALHCPSGTRGSGPAIVVRQEGMGRAIGVSITNCRVDGATTQGMLIDGDDVAIDGCQVQHVVDQCVRFQSGSRSGRVSNCRLVGGTYGLTAQGNAQVIAQNNVIDDATIYGMFAADTATIASRHDLVRTSRGTATGKAAGATLSVLPER